RSRTARPAPRGTAEVAARGRGERADRDLGGDQVEGFHAVRELLAARTRRVREVWVVERVGGADEIARAAAAAGVRVRAVGPAQLDERARSEAPQGVLAFAA